MFVKDLNPCLERWILAVAVEAFASVCCWAWSGRSPGHLHSSSFLTAGCCPGRRYGQWVGTYCKVPNGNTSWNLMSGFPRDKNISCCCDRRIKYDYPVEYRARYRGCTVEKLTDLSRAMIDLIFCSSEILSHHWVPRDGKSGNCRFLLKPIKQLVNHRLARCWDLVRIGYPNEKLYHVIVFTCITN